MNIDYTHHYKNWHDGSYEKSLATSKSYYPYLLHLALPNDKKILDIGCGMGCFLLAARDLGYSDIQGIDISIQQVAIAKKHGLPALHIADSHAWLHERPEVYDAIFLYDVLEHIPIDDQIPFVTRIYSALKPGGVLFLKTPNANSTFSSRFRWIDWTHHCIFTEHSLDFVLHHGGFSQIEVREDYFGALPLWFPRPSLLGLLKSTYFAIRRLQAIAEFGLNQGKKMPLTINIIGIARKTA